MNHTLKNGQHVELRPLRATDAPILSQYLLQLSPESRSRFGPHPFDASTVNTICATLDASDTSYFIAVDDASGQCVSYMLIKQGMIDGDAQRYASRNLHFDSAITVTFAPSVADAWQSSGLGSAMNKYIESILSSKGIRTIILWGGVQASNQKAVNFYKKAGYQYIDSFWHDGKDNYDMIKML